MPHIDTMFDDPFLKAAHLDGRDVTVTMLKVTQEAVGVDKELRPVLFVEQFAKGIVLNKTNARRIVGLYGPTTEDWTGKQITLFPTEAEFKGESVECIRIRAQVAHSEGEPTP